MDYINLKRKAKERFAEYTSNYDMSQIKIALKAKHTYKVADICQRIAIAEKLSEQDICIAWLCGLLHDIGRFEQAKRFNTFYDNISVDHAHFSCEILWGTDSLEEQYRCPDSPKEAGIIREFIQDDSFDHLIRTAIWWHSAYRYPDDLSSREKMFCDILRDADKIDIFRVNYETPINEIHNLPIEEFYTSSVTPEVYDCFKNHTCVLRSLKKTAVDNIVSYICLYYELVFDESKNIAIEQGYLDKLANFESKNDETKTIFSQIRKELGLKCVE